MTEKRQTWERTENQLADDLLINKLKDAKSFLTTVQTTVAVTSFQTPPLVKNQIQI